MNEIIDYEREIKLKELDDNFQSKKSMYTRPSGDTYIISSDNIQDIIGLITLGVDSNLGLIHTDGTFTLVMHTVAELTTLLDEIRVYLTNVKTNRFTLKQQLLGMTDPEAIRTLNVTL